MTRREAEHVRIPHVYLSIQSASTGVLQALFRFFSPFTLMKDVNRGSKEERAAAFRHRTAGLTVPDVADIEMSI